MMLNKCVLSTNTHKTTWPSQCDWHCWLYRFHPRSIWATE